MKIYFIFFSFVLITISESFAEQFENYKFSKVSIEDLQKKQYEIDPDASAVILADVGFTEMEGTSLGGFRVVLKRKCRIKILKKSAYNVANLKIRLNIFDGYRDRIDGIKGTTYNLVNGAIVETKLTDNSIFTEEYNKRTSYKKISLPQVKEGSVIEFSYNFYSDNIFLFIPWDFQSIYPTLYSEYRTFIPDFFRYNSLLVGKRKFDTEKSATSSKAYSILFSDDSGVEKSEHIVMNTGVSERQMIITNIPAFVNEEFISSPRNYMAHLSYQLSGYKYTNMPFKNTIKTWAELTESLLLNNDFGNPIYKRNKELQEFANTIVKENQTKDEKVKSVYYYLQHNFSTFDEESIYLNQPFSSTLNKKAGSITDINLLFVALLHQLDIKASPVIVQRKQNGYPFVYYPFLDGFDYVLCRAELDSSTYLMDASQKNLPIGQLPLDCYNGFAQQISRPFSAVGLFTNDIKAESRTVFELSIIEDQIVGKCTFVPNAYEALQWRSLSKKSLLKNFAETLEYSDRFKADSTSISYTGKENLDEPLIIKYEFKIPIKEKSTFINGLLIGGIQQNPFHSNNRLYPFELPHAISNTTVVSMEIPSGYVLDEIPKSIKSVFNEDEGTYDFIVKSFPSMLQIKSKLQLHKTVFSNEESQALIDFFDMVIKKNSEQIVLRKK